MNHLCSWLFLRIASVWQDVVLYLAIRNWSSNFPMLLYKLCSVIRETQAGPLFCRFLMAFNDLGPHQRLRPM
jgi:hypothetical protein